MLKTIRSIYIQIRTFPMITYRTSDEFGNINYYLHELYELIKINLVDSLFQEVNFFVMFQINLDAYIITINSVNYTEDSDKFCNAIPNSSIETCITEFIYKLFNEHWRIEWNSNYKNEDINLDIVDMFNDEIQEVNYKNMHQIHIMDRYIYY